MVAHRTVVDAVVAFADEPSAGVNRPAAVVAVEKTPAAAAYVRQCSRGWQSC